MDSGNGGVCGGDEDRAFDATKLFLLLGMSGVLSVNKSSWKEMCPILMFLQT